jgi:hypothetical protein
MNWKIEHNFWKDFKLQVIYLLNFKILNKWQEQWENGDYKFITDNIKLFKNIFKK